MTGNAATARIKSAVAITPVTASGFPADEATKQFLWGLIRDATMTAQGIAELTRRTAAGALVGADGAQQPRHLRCGGNARLFTACGSTAIFRPKPRR